MALSIILVLALSAHISKHAGFTEATWAKIDALTQLLSLAIFALLSSFGGSDVRMIGVVFPLIALYYITLYVNVYFRGRKANNVALTYLRGGTIAAAFVGGLIGGTGMIKTPNNYIAMLPMVASYIYLGQTLNSQ